MNVRFVLYLLGNLLIFVSPLPGICAVAAYFHAHEFRDIEVISFVIPMAVLLLVGGFALRRVQALSHGYPVAARRYRDGSTGMDYRLLCRGVALLHSRCRSRLKPCSSRSSGFTTTGSTIYSDIESLPPAILLWRSLSQWVGGIGILVLLVAVLSGLGIGGRALIGAESSVNLGATSTAKIKDLAWHLLIVYLVLTALCFFALLAAGWLGPSRVSAFDALLYAMSTVSTGGFAPHNDSAAHFDSVPVESVLIFFMFVSSLSFILLYRWCFRFEFSKKPGWEEAKAYLVILLLVNTAVVIDLVLYNHISILEALRKSVFPIVSMASSTGFGTYDYDQWPLMSKTFLAFLMIIGGCGGSTAGGLKVMRFHLLTKILRIELQKTFRPNLVRTVQLDSIKVGEGARYRVLIYVVTVGFLLIVSTGIVSVMELQVNSFETAIGAVLGTFFNMGPGFGEVGPTDNFSSFHSYTLLFLSWLMLIGRLEIFVLMALFSPALWKVK